MNVIRVVGDMDVEGNQKADELVHSDVTGTAITAEYLRLCSAFNFCPKPEPYSSSILKI